jgi:hypothetical protein
VALLSSDDMEMADECGVEVPKADVAQLETVASDSQHLFGFINTFLEQQRSITDLSHPLISILHLDATFTHKTGPKVQVVDRAGP